MGVRPLLLGLAVALTVGGCSGDAEGASDTSAPGTDEVATTLDSGPFCTNVRQLEGLGGDSAEAETPEGVLAQADETLAVVDEIAATVPDGAPPQVEVLLDDFRAIVEGIVAAGGDRDAAYTVIQANQPELWARLSDPAAHDAAFAFFAERCGTPLP